MSIRLRPAHKKDAPAVARLLHTHMNRKIPETRWLRLFDPPWSRPVEALDHGCLAEVDGEVVGFIGRIYAERRIRGQRELTASLSSWYLRKEFRQGSLGLDLYQTLLDDRGAATYSVVSIARRTLPLYDRWGFGLLDSHRRVWNRTEAPIKVEILTDPISFESRLTTDQAQILQDHCAFDLLPVWVEGDAGSGLFIFVAKRKDGHRLHLDLLYGDNGALLAEAAPALARTLLPEDSALLAADERFLRGCDGTATREQIPVPRRFLSDHLQPPDLDFLYSEIVLLDLKLD
ncbi:GNAT family N-acetyltransferase [Magnetospira sp. QH-2]|uniref:GNAT family N-acetyltransferase n=1 Tax=Magnetospira sp. (strain QH-2) TaxID=1288970 RepID=UPI0003E80D3A|nr:hypothetical protein [Magnetospira sp. QH-2]CCQ74926.1 protein of unknown function [Magnetospira sp. QH-2]